MMLSGQSSECGLTICSVRIPDTIHTMHTILISRGRAPLCQHQESQPVARSNDIPVLNGFVNTID